MRIDCSLKKNAHLEKCKRAVGEARFSLILPKRDNSGRPIKTKLLNKYIKGMNNIFGGSSTLPRIEGCYIDKKGKAFCEQNIEIIGVRDFESPYDKSLRKLNSREREKKLNKDWVEVKKLGKKARKEFGQESVLLINDKINDATIYKGKGYKKISNKKIAREIIFP